MLQSFMERVTREGSASQTPTDNSRDTFLSGFLKCKDVLAKVETFMSGSLWWNSRPIKELAAKVAETSVSPEKEATRSFISGMVFGYELIKRSIKGGKPIPIINNNDIVSLIKEIPEHPEELDEYLRVKVDDLHEENPDFSKTMGLLSIPERNQFYKGIAVIDTIVAVKLQS